MFYVYMYKHPETLVPFYVGKGSGRRHRKHLFETWNNTTNQLRLSKILSIRAAGQEPLIEIVASNLTESEALECERSLISTYRKIIDGSGTLTNVLDGGNQPPVGVGNPNWKSNNPSTALKGVSYNDRYGADRSAEIRRTRSQSSLGRVFGEETRLKMKISAQQRTDRTYLHKTVITPNGTFDTMKAAATSHNIDPSTLTYRVKSAHPRWADWCYSGKCTTIPSDSPSSDTITS